jgi:hypothetical protein
MKTILFLFAFVPLTAYGQNPDGKNASLHLSPIWTWGSSDYSRMTTIWYPPTTASPEQTVINSDAGTMTNPFAFGFSTLFRVPATSYLTLNISYTFQQRFEEFGISDSETKYFSQYWKTNGLIHTVGLTVSFYNLFSVYQGE